MRAMIFLPLLLGLPPVEPIGPFESIGPLESVESIESLGPVEPFQSTRQRAKVESKALSWSFVEVHAQDRNVDAIDEHLTGFGARGGWDLSDGFFLRGGVDLFSDDQDLTRYDLGAGHHVEIQKDTEVYASVSWVHLEVDNAGAGNSDDNGWRAEVGMRSLLDQKLEGEARIGYEDVADNGLIYGADLRWWWTANVGVGLGYEREVDDDLFTLGLRYAF
jgi:hypothetical protein